MADMADSDAKTYRPIPILRSQTIVPTVPGHSNDNALLHNYFS